MDHYATGALTESPDLTGEGLALTHCGVSWSKATPVTVNGGKIRKHSVCLSKKDFFLNVFLPTHKKHKQIKHSTFHFCANNQKQITTTE